MDVHCSVARFSSRLRNTGLVALAFGGALGCQQSDASASNGPGSPAPVVAPEPPSSPTSAAPPTSAALSATASGQAEYKESAFQLVLMAPSKVEVGKSMEFTIMLTAQGGYKINEEYPIKFQFSETKGITPAKQTFTKDDVRLEKTKATMPVTVTIQAPGKHEVSGKFSFSVCTDERCLIEKRDLRVEVNAS